MATAQIYYGFPQSNAQASVTLSGKTAQFTGAATSSATAGVLLNGSYIPLYGHGVVSFSAVLEITGASDIHGMNVCGVVDEILAMWGIFNRKTAPSFALSRAMDDINSALQLLWNESDDRSYWTNDTITIVFADGDKSQVLGNDIQNVIGPCRRLDNRQMLVPIGTIGELESFTDIYLDGNQALGPVAYYIQRLNQDGNDPVECIFHVTPPVSGGSVSFLLDVVKEPPRFTLNDLDVCPVIPIPHRYVESLLLPIARYQASSFYLFRQQDQKPTIDREYAQARVYLGLADPLPGKAGDNIGERKQEGGKA